MSDNDSIMPECAWCHNPVERLRSRGEPFKYCSVECDKAATGARGKARKGQKNVRREQRRSKPSPVIIGDDFITVSLNQAQVHMIAVGLAVLRDNIIKRDGDLRKCPEIDEVGDVILKSEWYREIVLGKDKAGKR